MKKIKLLSLFVLASTALTACSLASVNNSVKENEGKAEEQEIERHPPLSIPLGGRKEVQQYIDDSVKDYDEADILKRQYDTIDFHAVTTEEDQGFQIIVEHKNRVSITSGDAPITNLLANDLIFPGALIIPDDKLMSQSPTIASIGRGRMPFSILLNGSGLDDPEFTVVPDKRSKVHKEVQDRLDTWKSNHSRTAQTQTSLEQVFSRSQIDTKLGFGVGRSLNIDKEYKTSSTKNLYVATYTDVFYSVGVEMASTHGSIFSPSVSKEDVERITRIDDKYYPPLLVTNCKYGRTIYLKIETELNKEQVKNGLEYAGSFDVERQKKFNDTFKNSSISCMCYGGAKQNLVEWFEEDNFAQKIAEVFSADDVVKDDILNGALLSYSCNFIDHNMKFADVFSATDYVETTYKVLKEQVVYIKNEGGYALESWAVGGFKIVGWEDDGKPIYETKDGKLAARTLEKSDDAMTVLHDVTYRIPPRYARLMFKYNIDCDGKGDVFNRRIDPSQDWFEKAEIYTQNVSWEPYTVIIVNGSTRYEYR